LLPQRQLGVKFDDPRFAGIGMLTKPDTALLALDLQWDFLQPRGRLPIGRDQAPWVIETLNRAARAAAARGWPVIYVLNAFELFDPSNLFRNFAAIRGSAGARFDPRVVRPPGAVVLDKQVPDAFTNPRLALQLRERRIGRLMIGGVFADACVKATALSGLARGLEVLVLEDGVGAATAGARQAALDLLARRGARVGRAFV
jgi:nicotinamidase-related amidase